MKTNMQRLNLNLFYFSLVQKKNILNIGRESVNKKWWLKIFFNPILKLKHMPHSNIIMMCWVCKGIRIRINAKYGAKIYYSANWKEISRQFYYSLTSFVSFYAKFTVSIPNEDRTKKMWWQWNWMGRRLLNFISQNGKEVWKWKKFDNHPEIIK